MTATLVKRARPRGAEAEMLAAVARTRGPMARLLRTGIADVRQSITDAAIADLWPDLDAIIETIDWSLLLPTAKAAEPVLVEEVIIRAMAAGADLARLAARLDVTDPAVIADARRLAGNLVTRVSATSRRAIRSAVTQSVSADLTRSELRALVRQVVGLTPRQAQAVANYHLALHRLAAGDTTPSAVQARFTLGGRPPARPTAAQIARATDRYAERQLRWRATNIERTELMRAANAGRVAGWEQAVRDGLLDRASRKVWVTVPDERRCPRCAPMDGQTISLTETFTSDEVGAPGQDRTRVVPVLAYHPPLHPQCRCTVDILPA